MTAVQTKTSTIVVIDGAVELPGFVAVLLSRSRDYLANDLQAALL